MKPMRWEFFMGYRCYSPNTWVMWTYPKSALSPISCVQTVACSIKKNTPWECKNLMQVSFKWLLEPHEIGVWHFQRAKTILYSWDGKSKKLDPPTTPISSVPSIYNYMFVCLFSSQNSFSGNVRGFPIQSNLSVCRSEKVHEFKCSRNGFRCFRCSKSI